MRAGLIAAAVFGPMVLEARRAWRHERQQRARGAVEPEGDVYTWMQVVYPAVFAAMIVESLVRGSTPAAALASGVPVFVAAKALKYWAIASLGDCWTFRVLVVPGAPLVRSGPYRFVRHPNYIAVIGELVGVALMSAAIVAGPLGTLLFASLVARRIAVEDAILSSRDASARHR